MTMEKAPVPEGFAAAARTTPIKQLARMYNRSTKLIGTWLSMCGLQPYRPRTLTDELRDFLASPACEHMTTTQEFTRAFFNRTPTRQEYERAKQVWYATRDPTIRRRPSAQEDDILGMRKLPLLPSHVADLRAAANADTWLRLPAWIDEEEAA